MVKAWREIVTIPTYEVGKPEKSPMFLEKRVYQGSSGVVYPYPVIEKIADEPTPHEWKAVFIENEYLKVMVLPELGGRIQMAYDKVKERHFVYYNHVIKPALVGLAGPWISGGIEFNWPQHHRPSTYMPIDCDIVENEDGSITVWVNEMERMFHQKGAAGFTLRPGCAYLEIQGRVSNRTPLPQTFLWWANPAVEVNDAYQSVFPPDVNAVFDHGKRAVSSFPIATGTYYKMDYSAGVDISNYKNIYVPTSYMAVNSKYDFEGGYENDTKGGMLHVASHHFSPGKKQWTWGNGDFGRAWDRNLTDPTLPPEGGISGHKPSPSGEKEGGYFRPYIELMAGVYTENQPDFTWLMPYEEKQFVQYFMPYRELGVVKQASKDFIMNIESLPPTPSEERGRLVTIKVLATSKQEVRIVLRNKQGEEYYNKVLTLSPEAVFEETVDVKGATLNELLFTINKLSPSGEQEGGLNKLSPSGEQERGLSWQAEPDEIRPIPDAAEAALSPEDTKTNDQLYLTGLHLEQYRHATWSALDYYEEALRRDPNDVRCLSQTGLWYLRRGRFDKAEPYLRKAVKIWQKRNPNPYDGEAIFYLALCLKYLHRPQEAYELFWKSTWNKAWADAGYFEAACISTAQGRYDDALDELNRCLVFNSCNHKARALKAAVLRYMANPLPQKKQAFIDESLALDHFNYGILYEQYLMTKDESVLKQIQQLMHDNVYNYHELALDYAQAGLWQECIDILQLAAEPHPMTQYYLGWALLNAGDAVAANAAFEQAEQVDSYCCFPNRMEDVLVLSLAKTMNPDGARAPYYLGCLYYDKRQYDVAIENWELAAELDPQFPTVWRNLALGYFNKQGRQDEALECMERAFSLDDTDARMLMELDQLYKRLQKPCQERLAFLQHYPQLIAQRDDLVLEEITLLNQLGRYEEAMKKLDAHKFHPWEGGEGKVPAQYQLCRVELAKQVLATQPERAIALLKECLEYPPHLGEGKLYGAQENDFYYYLGIAYDALGQKEKARECWEEATKGPQEPAAAMYYNDAKPEKIYYQGLALRKLGRDAEANGRFYKLINYGKQHIFQKQVMDYFAVSLPDLLIWDDSLDEKNRIHCLRMMRLGYEGLGDSEHANINLKT
jgi:tetratricopeptide (TPR) repeat protein